MASFFGKLKKVANVARTVSAVSSVTNAVRSGNSRNITTSVLNLANTQRNINSQIDGISGFSNSSFSNIGGLRNTARTGGLLGGNLGILNNILGSALELEGIVNSPIRVTTRSAQEIFDLTGGRFDNLRKQVENLSQISAFDKFVNNNFSDPRDPIKKTGDARSRIPNPLRDFASYNYKITMGILNNSEYNNPSSYRQRGFETYIIKSTGGELGKRTKVDQETIASPPGDAEYFIDDLTYDGVVAPNPSTGVSLGTTLSFKVVEPYSMGNFVESITVAAKLANNGQGYKSYFKAPFCIRIDFTGWTEDQSQYNLQPVYLPIMITKMDMRVTGEGSEYDVSAVAFNEQGLADHVNKLYTSVKAVGTFAHEILQTGEESVTSALNKRVEKLEDSNIVPGYDRFIICFPKNADSINRYLETGLTAPEEKSATQAIQEAKGTASELDPNDPDVKLNNRQQTADQSVTKPVTSMFETLLAFASDEAQMNEIGKSALVKESTTGGDQAMGKLNGALQSDDNANNPNADAANEVDAGIEEDPDNPCGPDVVPQPGLNEKDSATTAPAEFSRQYSFNKGEKIITVIEKIIVQSEYAKANATEESDEKGIKRWFRIDTQTFLEENVKTEEELGRPPMVYVFAIHPYEADEAKFLGPNQTPKNTQGLKESAAKEYNYLYTGLNEDVLGFDIVFNTSFMRTALGNYGNNAGATQSGTANSKVAKTEQSTNAGGPGNKTAGSQTSNEAKPGVTETTNNNTGAASRDADIRRQIAENFHNILINQPSDMISVDMQIWGDPFFLPQEIGNYHPKQEGSSPNATSDGTMLYTKGEVFVVVNFRSPFDYQTNGATMEFPLIVPQFSGLFTVYQVSNRFSNGQYTQNLKLVRRVGQDTPATQGNTGTMTPDDNSNYNASIPDSSMVDELQFLFGANDPPAQRQKEINQTLNLLEQGSNAGAGLGTAINDLATANLSAVSNLSNTGLNAANALRGLANPAKNTAQQAQSFFNGDGQFDANKFKAGIPDINLQTSGNSAFDLSAAVNQALLVAVPAFGAFQVDTSTPEGKLGLLASELQDGFNSALGTEIKPEIPDLTEELQKAQSQVTSANLSPASVRGVVT